MSGRNSLGAGLDGIPFAFSMPVTAAIVGMLGVILQHGVSRERPLSALLGGVAMASDATWARSEVHRTRPT